MVFLVASDLRKTFAESNPHLETPDTAESKLENPNTWEPKLNTAPNEEEERRNTTRSRVEPRQLKI